jgi:hypothetical protein
MVMQSRLLIIKEKLNSEKNKGVPTFPAEENHMLTVMNSQHSSNPIEPIKIIKCRQICVTTFKSSSKHGKKYMKDKILRSQLATYMI